jgi:hypothetical protein
MKFITILILFIGTSLCHAQYDRFNCLSMIETGHNDKARGLDGEVSRYQIKPEVWHEYAGNLPLSAAQDPFKAWNVVQRVMKDRVNYFIKTNRRQPNEREWALLWHRPFRKHFTAADHDYAMRFNNLRSLDVNLSYN